MGYFTEFPEAGETLFKTPSSEDDNVDLLVLKGDRYIFSYADSFKRILTVIYSSSKLLPQTCRRGFGEPFFARVGPTRRRHGGLFHLSGLAD